MDAAFTGRLCRHLSAEVTVLTVLRPPPESDIELRAAERYLAAAARTVGSAGCKAATRIRFGEVEEQIRQEMLESRHEMLVVGAPQSHAGAPTRVAGVVARLLLQATHPVLVVRGRGGA